MEDLPIEILNEILSHLDKPILFQASNVCKLWRQLALTYVIEINDSEQLERAARNGDRLSIIKSEPGRLAINWCLLGACQGGHKDIAELMITKGAFHVDVGLKDACENGHKDLAILMLAKGATNVEWGLQSACKGGHEDLVQLMITEGAENFNCGLKYACEQQHKNIIKLMIAKGADECHCGKSIEEHLNER